MAKEYVLKSEAELRAAWEAVRDKDREDKRGNIEKLLAFFCGEKQEPGIVRPEGSGERGVG